MYPTETKGMYLKEIKMDDLKESDLIETKVHYIMNKIIKLSAHMQDTSTHLSTKVHIMFSITATTNIHNTKIYSVVKSEFLYGDLVKRKLHSIPDNKMCTISEEYTKVCFNCDQDHASLVIKKLAYTLFLI